VFLEDGRVEMDTNCVENLIRPVALNRKNAVFAGHDEGTTAWGRIASLINVERRIMLNRGMPALRSGAAGPASRNIIRVGFEFPAEPLLPGRLRP